MLYSASRIISRAIFGALGCIVFESNIMEFRIQFLINQISEYSDQQMHKLQEVTVDLINGAYLDIDKFTCIVSVFNLPSTDF